MCKMHNYKWVGVQRCSMEAQKAATVESNCGHTERVTIDDVPNDVDMTPAEWARKSARFHNWTCDDNCAIAVPDC